MHSFSVISANITIDDISLKTRFFGLHFRRRKYRSTFNHFYFIGPKNYRIRRKKTQDNGYYAVQGHSRSDFGTNRKPICDFLLVFNTNLHPISHRFEVRSYCRLLVKFALSTEGYPSLTHLFGGEPLNSGPLNLACRN